jgi:hypothetical protein
MWATDSPQLRSYRRPRRPSSRLIFAPQEAVTIDVPVELHRRVKAACAMRGINTSSVLRDLLEREFPETSGQFRLPL